MARKAIKGGAQSQKNRVRREGMPALNAAISSSASANQGRRLAQNRWTPRGT